MRILEIILYIPTILMFNLTIIIMWINSIISIPFKIYKYGLKKGLKYWYNANIYATQDILGNL